MEDDLHRELSASLSLPTAGPLSGWPQAFIRQLVLTIRPLLLIVPRHGLPIRRSISRELPVVVVTQPRNSAYSIHMTVIHEARAHESAHYGFKRFCNVNRFERIRHLNYIRRCTVYFDDFKNPESLSVLKL